LIDSKEARIQEFKKATNQAGNLARVIDDNFDDVGFFLLINRDSPLKKKPDKKISK